ncbi:MAG TPA: hypothetical protein VGD99_04430 [Anaerolineae bacterium]
MTRTIFNLINETTTKIQEGVALTDEHYLVALAALANLGVSENKDAGLPLDHGRFYSDLQNDLANLEASFPNKIA